MGHHLLDLANGIDKGSVHTESKRKSISSETTLPEDVSTFETVKQLLLDRSQSVGRQLRKKKLLAQTITIKLKFSDFSQITRSRTIDTGICTSNAIFDHTVSLYKKINLKKKIRLVGVGVSSLKDRATPFQLPLLSPRETDRNRWESVDKAVDCIGEKYGTHIVKKASLKDLNHRRSSNAGKKNR